MFIKYLGSAWKVIPEWLTEEGGMARSAWVLFQKLDRPLMITIIVWEAMPRKKE